MAITTEEKNTASTAAVPAYSIKCLFVHFKASNVALILAVVNYSVLSCIHCQGLVCMTSFKYNTEIR